mmetsp:Transcript_64885/g.152570  ORF Transcript_64885/g.152570 Transcript_64885/m.152570 type:complete len:462 (-) Transcript_64885:115-1500(-)
MAHLVGLRAAVATGAHLSTYRGCWGRAALQLRHNKVSELFSNRFSSLQLLDVASLVGYVESSPLVPLEAKRAFKLFADDIQAVAHQLSLVAKIVTFLAVEAHMRSHQVLQQDLDRDATIAASPLRPPIFIAGLPRTGTTLLHHLLALDPESQCLRAFELMRATRPLHGWLPAGIVDFFDWACLAVAMRIGEVLAPQWPHHHSLDASSPEECLFALQRSMPLDTHYRARPRLPSTYVEEKEIPLAAYERYRSFLQQVQKRRKSEEKRYVLKGQLLHLQYMAQLRSAFPEAKVIWSHRPVEQVVGSLCSLRRSQQEVFLRDPPDKAEVGRGVLKYLADALERARDALKDEKCKESLIHVRYESLVEDPVAVVEQIYAAWGWQVSEAHRQAMERYLEQSLSQRSRAEGGRSRYHDASLASYGLTEHAVRRHFRQVDFGRDAFEGSQAVVRHSELLARSRKPQLP